MTSDNGVGAFNATVRVGEPEPVVQAAREQRVLDCDAAVAHIDRKIAAFQNDLDALGDAVTEAHQTKLAGLEAALTAAKAEATQARAEAHEGN